MYLTRSSWLTGRKPLKTSLYYLSRDDLLRHVQDVERNLGNWTQINTELEIDAKNSLKTHADSWSFMSQCHQLTSALWTRGEVQFFSCISEEYFWSFREILHQSRLRAHYGITGNVIKESFLVGLCRHDCEVRSKFFRCSKLKNDFSMHCVPVLQTKLEVWKDLLFWKTLIDNQWGWFYLAGSPSLAYNPLDAFTQFHSKVIQKWMHYPTYRETSQFQDVQLSAGGKIKERKWRLIE